MALTGEQALAIAKKYVSETAEGMGAVKGQDGFSPIIAESAGNTDSDYRLDVTTASGTFTTDNLKGPRGEQGNQGIQGERGAQGEQGIQGIQGIQGEKGDDGYPFLIFKEYTSLSDFQASDFPEIGLMFMIKEEDSSLFPVYRYTGNESSPYSYITSLSGSEGIKGDKGDKGDQGEQGIEGPAGKDGTTYTPTIGTVTSGESAGASVDINQEAKTAAFNFTLPKGEKGDKGEDGAAGQNGINGKSSYEIWLDEGNTGTEAEFLQSLKGDPGEKGDPGDGANITIDDTMSDTSVNPVQNKIVKKYIDDKTFTADITEGSTEDTPVGHIISYMGNNVPEHYLKCDGTVYNISDYPYLTQHFIDNLGSVNFFGGDGATTFAVPDLRGEFLRGTGTNSHTGQGNGADVGRHQDGTAHASIVYSNVKQIGISHGNNTGSVENNIDSRPGSGANRVSFGNGSESASSTGNNYTSRPTNTSVLYCIKYESTLVSTKGEDGKSTYQIWLDQGNTGTEAEFLETIKGEKGNDGKSIYEIAKDENNNIIVTFSDGSVKNIGQLNIDVQADFLTSEGFGNLRYYNNRFQYFDTATSSWIDASATPDNTVVINFTPKPVKSISASYNRQTIHFELKWEEPDDTYLDGQLFCAVEKVVVVRKKDLVPETIEDGTKILEVKRKDFHSYTTVPYVDETLTPVEGDVWYYKIFPVSTSGMINNSDENSVQIIAKNVTLYGFKIDQNESDPSSMITYIEDNKDFRPVHMDFDTDTFDYGDWADAWFMKVRPCMLNFDGTVAFYLNPDDYYLKEDGTNGDIASVDRTIGNVMIEFPKVYWKIVDNGNNTANIYVSDTKIDEGFHCWSHIDANGDEIDYCYMPAYNGYRDSNGRLRSIAEYMPTDTLTAQQEITLATANNVGNDKIWYTEVFADRQLVNILLLLIGKSTDTQTVFGMGNSNSYVDSNNTGLKSTGLLNKKGLFWGDNTGKNGVKIFGMEHYWGNMLRRIAGLISADNTQKVKMVYGQQDGSTVDGYNVTGDGYITIPNSEISGGSGYISGVIFNEYGLIIKSLNGSYTTYYADMASYNNNSGNYPLVGGYYKSNQKCGIFNLSLNNSISYKYNIVNASISCKPYANKN